jgi:hypothetical protein
MLGILLNYGAELGLPGCLELAELLERMTLPVPEATRRAWKAARPKKAGMIYEQAAAIVAEGRRRGTRRHRSVALRVAAQFELTLRQVDVIGTFEKLDQAEAVQASAVVERGRIWRSGLRFEDFAAGRLDVETSKTSTQAVYDVTAYPLFQQAYPLFQQAISTVIASDTKPRFCSGAIPAIRFQDRRPNAGLHNFTGSNELSLSPD